LPHALLAASRGARGSAGVMPSHDRWSIPAVYQT